VLSGGLTVDNVAEAVQRVQPAAVDVSSGVESLPGIKDEKKMTAFMERVRNANV
jgi:phosphoribosylanthranilate isomerase